VWPVYDSYEIYRAKADGSGLTRLASSPGYDAEATVAPDGLITFTSVRDGDMEIYSMKADAFEPGAVDVRVEPQREDRRRDERLHR
jgi:Tol biopolymer transport system component